MITQKIKKLKKYLFFISIMFFVLTLVHISYSYLVSNSNSQPVKWWTVSEWLIGKFPNLNPLVPLYSDWNDKYIIQLLYRSILKYDIDQHKIVWDIANCDISSMVNIECIINEDAKWSNWENITAEDILATYNLIKETNSNKILVSLLSDTKIETKDNVIIFKNTKKDVNFLNIFLQPILNKSFINTLTNENITWDFPTNWGIYSWKFIIDKVTNDENLWISKITLVKNENYDKSNINKIILNIFPDINSFKKNYWAVNVFNDYENNIWNSISKFQSKKYTLNSFIWLFLNQAKIENSDLRTYILNKIDNEKLINVLWKENFEEILNPFLTTEKISSNTPSKTFDTIMNSLGYKKKSVLIQEATPKVEQKTTTTTENKVETKNTTVSKEITIPEDLTLDRYQKDSKIITNPDYVDIYNFVTKDDILLTWKTVNWTTAVYVNDYKITNFKSWDSEFYYRLKESIWNINAWKNSYKIYFEINGEKVFQEEIIFIYYHDKDKLAEEEKNLAISLYRAEKEAEIKKSEAEAQKQKEEAENKKVNTWAVETTEDKAKKEQLAKLEALDENIFYSKDLKPFTLKLYYIWDWKKETTETVAFIENSLKELWITVESIWFSVNDLIKIISNKNDYDMILSWVHLWYLNFNLFPYLHSSQVKTWYNFSSIKKPSLDVLIEEMKENIYTEEKTQEYEKKILDILKSENTLKTLYSPKVNLLVDKSIKIDKTYSSLPYKSERSSILENSYIKEETNINWKEKSFSGFFKYIFKKITE